MIDDFFQYEQVNDHLIRIRDITETACYLVLGEQRAMLLDTGIGVGDLRGLVDSLTHLPYDVLLTHGHMDHAGGAAQFSDKTVYLHLADRELMERSATVSVRRKFAMENAVGSYFTDSDMPPSLPPAQTMPLRDGQVFDLGGQHLTVIHTPGHTQGMCMVLMQEMRTILFGDGCGMLVLLLEDCASSVSQYVKTLEKLRAYEPKYDHIIRNHGTCISEKPLLGTVMECCFDVLAGRDDHIPVSGLSLSSPDAFLARAVLPGTVERVDGKEGNLVYTTSKK